MIIKDWCFEINSSSFVSLQVPSVLGFLLCFFTKMQNSDMLWSFSPYD